MAYIPVQSGPNSPDFVPPEGLQKKDRVLKVWVRVLKFISRLLSLACSGVVIGLSATSFSVFLATRSLPPIDGVQPWARRTVLWPQVMTLVIACLSFAAAAAVMAGYVCGGHRRAESLSRWATATTAIGFIGWIAVWAAAGASLQRARDLSTGRDIWAWACGKETLHHELFQGRIDYDLVCIAQDWNFICSWIQVVTITFSALAWAVAAWRVHARSKLPK